VRPISEIVVVGRRPEATDRFVTETATRIGLPVRPGEPDAIADADLVCACTSSRTPVFDGSKLPAGVHVNAVGSFRPDIQELDARTVLDTRVVVEVREAALAETGDLIQAQVEAGWEPATIAADLRELLVDPSRGRTCIDDRTLFASVGHAFEDLVVARAIAGA
jgi:ornithine cyclodeaminase/alanine dehydrogenase-like protein (mu-crystallin family)